MDTCEINDVIKAVVDNGQDQFYAFGHELHLTPAQINSTIDGKPSTADKLRAIIDRRGADVGKEKLLNELLTACGNLPGPIKGAVEDQMKRQGKKRFGNKLEREHCESEVGESFPVGTPQFSKPSMSLPSADVASGSTEDSETTCPFPEQIQDFDCCIGREEELERLREFFFCTRQPSELAVQVVTGYGGMGKTELIFEYARRHRQDYIHGIYYFFMESLSTFYDSVRYNMITVGMEPTGKPKEDIVRFQCYARRFPKCLFLYDNLNEAPLKECLPSLSVPVDILVTTRRFQQSSQSVRVLDLQLPPTDNAVQILCKGGAPFLNISSDDPRDLKGKDLEYAEMIVGPDGVDRLPLALHHIKAFARDDLNGITMEELWKCIETNRCSISLAPHSLGEWLQYYHLKTLIPDLADCLGLSSLDDLRSLSADAIEESSLKSSEKANLFKAKEDLLQRPSVGPWRLDIERVCSKSPVCFDILAVASLLPSQGIHVSLIEDCVKNLSKTDFSRIQFNVDLRHIENFSLMTCSCSVTDSRIRTIHPFIQDTMKQCVVPAFKLAFYLSSLCEVLLHLLPSLDDLRMERGLTSSSVLRYSSDLYHVAGIDVESAEEQEAWRDVLDLTCVLAIRMHHTAIARSLCEKRLSLERRLESHLKPLVLGVTAVAYSMDKDESREGFDLIDEALELLKDDPPIGSKEEAEKWALAMDAVCSFYQNVSDWENFEICRERLFGVLEREKLTESDIYANALNGLAIACDFKGSVSKAEQLSRKCLAVYEQLLPLPYSNIGRELENLADYCLHLGKLDEAEKLINDAVKKKKDSLPADHPDFIHGIISLGKMCFQLGQYEKAETELRKAWTMIESAFLTEHQVARYALSSLASCLRNRGSYEEAEKYLRRAVDVAKKALGDDHIDTVTTRRALGCCLFEQSKFVESETLLRSSLDIVEHKQGERHLQSAFALYDLGMCLLEQKKLEESERYLRKAADIRQEKTDCDNITSAQTLETLGVCLMKQGKSEESQQCLQRALEMFKTTLGEDSSKLFSTLRNLGVCFLFQHKCDDAELCLRRAIDINIRHSGLPHDSANGWFHLGHCLLLQKKHADAEKALKNAISTNSRAQCQVSLETHHMLYVLGKCLFEQHKYRDAEVALKDALARQKEIEPSSVALAKTLHDLANCLRVNGNFCDAYDYLCQAKTIFRERLGEDHTETQAVNVSLMSLPSSYRPRLYLVV